MGGNDQESLLAGLREAGLSRYEANVYFGLITDQTARVSEISKRTGVPQPKVYQALDTLVEKGFCSLGGDTVNRYRPVPPGVALEGRIERLQSEQEGVRRLSRSLEVRFDEGRGHKLWAPPIEVLKGIGQIRRALAAAIGEATQLVCFFGKAPLVPSHEVPRALLDAGDRGVELCLLFEEDFLVPEAAPEEVALYEAMEGEKRWAKTLPTKLVLIDERVGLASAARSSGEPFLMLVLHHSGLLAHFRASFEHHWSKARR